MCVCVPEAARPFSLSFFLPEKWMVRRNAIQVKSLLLLADERVAVVGGEAVTLPVPFGIHGGQGGRRGRRQRSKEKVEWSSEKLGHSRRYAAKGVCLPGGVRVVPREKATRRNGKLRSRGGRGGRRRNMIFLSPPRGKSRGIVRVQLAGAVLLVVTRKALVALTAPAMPASRPTQTLTPEPFHFANFFPR